MPYEPPPGWVERRVYPATGPAVEDKERLRFHLRPDCTLIEAPEHLMAVDRPYSAARCSRCATDEISRAPTLA